VLHRTQFITGAAVLACSILVDQLSKNSIRDMLAVGESVHVAGPIYFTHVQNTGLVFGFGQGYVLVPTIASIIVLALIPIILRHLAVHNNYRPTTLETVTIALVAGGAIGNLIDRIAFSAVTDFVDVEVLPGIRWPAFNVADACIVVGTILLVLIMYRHGTSRSAHSSGM